MESADYIALYFSHESHRRFSGREHPELARARCRRLKVRLSPSTSTTFSNDCLGRAAPGQLPREADVLIVQPLSPPVQHQSMERS
jgi:phosphoribosylpyrophosphate synthetase